MIGAGHSQRIVKTGATAVECHFYRAIAPKLVEHGVATPAVFDYDPEAARLTLEYLPGAIAWPADRDAMVERLARLHEAPFYPGPRHEFAWPAETAAQGSRVFGLDRRDTRRVQRLREAAGALFEPRATICGDSNPGNWACRSDGSLVQFDWARFGRGHPAIDLAPLAGGLPSRSAATALAASYVAARAQTTLQTPRLAVLIRIGAAWLLMEVIMRLADTAHPMFERYRSGYGQQLPGWLTNVDAELDAW
ncbi:phosphotransferase [Salinisphaera sp. SPP-AMP-43]|uniref:phosphotransferase n=1 Tax=Salinisphaera sp. SPP-AMP-43 TaxID=3121288 RepID=UPI003C6E90F2